MRIHTPERWGVASHGYAEKVAPALMQKFADAPIERLGPNPRMEELEVGAGVA